MNDVGTRILDLLKRMQAMREQDPEQGGSTPAPPDGRDDRIRTLEPGVYRPLSPMLRARFAFAASWEDAFLTQSLLSLSEIEQFETNPELLELIGLRRENWSDLPPESVAPRDCAVFGYCPYGVDETYLVWSGDAVEPAVWTYSSSTVHHFKNLENFLGYIVDDRDSDDGIPGT